MSIWSRLYPAILFPATVFLALLHTRLVKSSPADKEIVTAAPVQVRLWFSSRPEPALTSIQLLKGDSSVVAKLKVAGTDDTTSVAGPIPSPMTAGEYIVVWKTASPDGHVIRGSYHFTFTPR